MLKRFMVLSLGFALGLATIGCGSNKAYMPEDKGESATGAPAAQQQSAPPPPPPG